MSSKYPDEQLTVSILPGFVGGFFFSYDNRYQICKVFLASAIVTGRKAQGRRVKCHFSMPQWTEELGLLQNDNVLPSYKLLPGHPGLHGHVWAASRSATILKCSSLYTKAKKMVRKCRIRDAILLGVVSYMCHKDSFVVFWVFFSNKILLSFSSHNWLKVSSSTFSYSTELEFLLLTLRPIAEVCCIATEVLQNMCFPC